LSIFVARRFLLMSYETEQKRTFIMTCRSP